jgi:Dolichyl-phosphate-mannose-protein mannosyltransferase
MHVQVDATSRVVRWSFLGAALVVAAAMYSTHITGDLYGDEVSHTFVLVTQGSSLFSVVDRSTTHPPLYFVLAKASYLLVGEPWAIRLPSLAFALGIILILPFTAREMLGDRFFFPAAGLGLLAPFTLEFSAEARSYTMVVFLSLAALWVLVRFMRTDSGRDLAVLLVVCGLGVLTHYFFGLLLVFIAVSYLLEKRGLPPGLWKYVLIAAALVAVALAALILGPGARFVHDLQGGWERRYFSPVNFLVRLPVALSYGFCTFRLPHMDPARNFNWGMLAANWLLALLVVIAFGGFVYALVGIWRGKAVPGRRLRLLLLWAAIPTVLAVLVGELGFYLPREKHLAVIWGSVFFLQLLGLGRLARSWPGRVVVCCHLAVLSVSCFHYIVYPEEYSRRMDWSGLSEAIASRARPGDAIASYAYAWRSATLATDPSVRTAVPFEVLAGAATGGAPIGEVASRLGRTTRGTIYLVDDETQRNLTDPSNTVANALRVDRRLTVLPFGRNLSLMVFSPADRGQAASPNGTGPPAARAPG